MNHIVDLGVLLEDVKRIRTVDHPVLVDILLDQSLVDPKGLVSLQTHILNLFVGFNDFLLRSQFWLLTFEFRKQVIVHGLFNEFLVVLLDDFHMDVALAISVLSEERYLLFLVIFDIFSDGFVWLFALSCSDHGGVTDSQNISFDALLLIYLQSIDFRSPYAGASTKVLLGLLRNLQLKPLPVSLLLNDLHLLPIAETSARAPISFGHLDVLQ